MYLGNRRERKGFTLIEIAISIAIMSILVMVVATLFIRTLDTYGQVVSETESIKQARYCFDVISRDARECTWFAIANGAALPPPDDPNYLVPVQNDALMMGSARTLDESYRHVFNCNLDDPTSDGYGKFVESSIILFYLNTAADGNIQLMRQQLYYDLDLPTYTPPFHFLPGSVYVDDDIVIYDANNVAVNIYRATGTVGGASTEAPKVLMNRTSSFDLALIDNESTGPRIDGRLVCQYVDRFGRTATSRLESQIDLRNDNDFPYP